jgi:hypothetical protein
MTNPNPTTCTREYYDRKINEVGIWMRLLVTCLSGDKSPHDPNLVKKIRMNWDSESKIVVTNFENWKSGPGYISSAPSFKVKTCRTLDQLED